MKSDEALEQIAYLKELTSKTRLIASYGYKYYILWGILSLTGFITAVYFNPMIIWTTIDIIGFLLTFLLILIDTKKVKASALLKKIGWQSLVLLISGFIIYYVIRRYEDYTILVAFWPFQIGIIYLVASVHMGKDLTFIGLWLIASSIASVFMPMPFQNFWLGAACGGGLILTGIIFRNQIKKFGANID